MNTSPSRREVLRAGAASLALAGIATPSVIADDAHLPAPRGYLTSAGDFDDVSRGNPIPHTLKAEALTRARLTASSWRLEIVAEDEAQAKNLTLSANTAITYDRLLELGKSKAIRYLKALQCNNIAVPLGQGLWEGVPLRDLLGLCGPIANVRRVFYWGFHNDDPKQLFQSSLAMNQVLDTPPGEMPPIVAYRLNGQEIPLERGGPVRMIVPWAHGFKSVKWLQRIVLTNQYQANDTYALANNDPESYLKTAAYFDSIAEQKFSAQPIRITGTAMVGWPGLKRIEYWLRATEHPSRDLPGEDPAWGSATWSAAVIDPAPDWAAELPKGTSAATIWGFGKEGQPREWPMRFSLAHWTIVLPPLKRGQYELRVRTVDQNDFAQPQPRPSQRSGKNQVQCKILSIQ